MPTLRSITEHMAAGMSRKISPVGDVGKGNKGEITILLKRSCRANRHIPDATDFQSTFT